MQEPISHQASGIRSSSPIAARSVISIGAFFRARPGVVPGDAAAGPELPARGGAAGRASAAGGAAGAGAPQSAAGAAGRASPRSATGGAASRQSAAAGGTGA